MMVGLGGQNFFHPQGGKFTHATVAVAAALLVDAIGLNESPIYKSANVQIFSHYMKALTSYHVSATLIVEPQQL